MSPSRQVFVNEMNHRSFLAAVAGLALWLGGVVDAQVQPPLITILTNGPVSNRLNIVVLSEGYTSVQLGQFLVDATNAVNQLLAHPPYSEYRGYCNAFAIKVASSQAGSDHPVRNAYVNTYFNSSYDPISDFLITIPPNFADTNYNDGQGKVDAILLTYLPQCQLPVLVVNDIQQGGSDGFFKSAIAAANASDPTYEILTHETGHVLANLGDEYTNANPGFPNTEEPNTTTNFAFNSIKWKSWINTNTTPIPTPPSAQYLNSVGLFQGAHYHAAGWYRPELNCAMGNFGSPFCPVCCEALVLAIYQHVRPVDAISPASTNLSVMTNTALTFTVNLLQPATHNLSVQWLTNGISAAGATNAIFSVLPLALGNKTNVVSALVRDNTPLVRNDPTSLLSQTVSWTVAVNIPQLKLDSAAWLPGGKFSFRVGGSASAGVVVQVSTNLATWTPLVTNPLVGGQFFYTNSGVAGQAKQFYRASTPP